MTRTTKEWMFGMVDTWVLPETPDRQEVLGRFRRLEKKFKKDMLRGKLGVFGAWRMRASLPKTDVLSAQLD